MNENLIFISYRRASTSPYALALRLELETRLQAVQVFLDTRSIQPGDVWPSEIEEALKVANVYIILIGSTWLAAADSKGRRIGDPEDWVRREVQFALEHRPGAIIPILLEGMQNSSISNLPKEIEHLENIQSLRLETDTWGHDIQNIVTIMEKKFQFARKTENYRFPKPSPLKARTIPIPWNDLKELTKKHLPSWRIEFSDDPTLHNYKRIQLVRSFEFSSFEEVMKFMSVIAAHASEVDHHPKWMNLWKTLTIWLSTWDAGHRVTDLDFQFAQVVERKYTRLVKRHP